jgi:hypothetical protein
MHSQLTENIRLGCKESVGCINCSIWAPYSHTFPSGVALEVYLRSHLSAAYCVVNLAHRPVSYCKTWTCILAMGVNHRVISPAGMLMPAAVTAASSVLSCGVLCSAAATEARRVAAAGLASAFQTA